MLKNTIWNDTLKKKKYSLITVANVEVGSGFSWGELFQCIPLGWLFFNLKGAFSVKYNINSENCKEL